MDLIYPYVKSVQIFVCPSNTGFKIGTPASPVPDYHLSGAYGNAASETTASTTDSHYATYNYGTSVVHTGTPVAAVVRASETVMAVDISGPMARYTLSLNPRFWPLYSNDVVNFRESFIPHLEGGNVIYGDGHVKWKSLTSMQAESGINSGARCNLSAINETHPYCSKLWNPFRP